MKIDRRNFVAGSAAATAAAVAAPSVLRAQGGRRSRSARSTATRRSRRSSIRTATAGRWRSSRSTPRAACWAARSRPSTATTAASRRTAVRHAGELINAEKVDLLAGGFLSNVGLAISDFANQNKRLYVASEPLTDALVWARGNRYTFRLRPSTYMQVAMLVEEAAKLPDQDLGLRGAELRVRPVVREVVQGAAEEGQAGRVSSSPSSSRRWARSTPAPPCRRWKRPSPKASSTSPSPATSSTSCARATRAGCSRAARWSSMLTGEPEYLDPLGAEAPKGWIVTGYPHAEIKTPEHTAFYDAYKAKFNDYPRLGSVVGFDTMNSIAAALAKAGDDRQREAHRRHARAEVRQRVRRRSSIAPSTINRRWAPTSAGSTSRTARA